jgi:hypothetical protein
VWLPEEEIRGRFFSCPVPPIESASPEDLRLREEYGDALVSSEAAILRASRRLWTLEETAAVHYYQTLLERDDELDSRGRWVQTDY